MKNKIETFDDIDAGGERARNARADLGDLSLCSNEAYGISLTDFYAFLPTHQYIYTSSCAFWPAPSVNARVPAQKKKGADGKDVIGVDGEPKFIPAADWLDRERAVAQMTWAPGLPMIIPDKLISDGSWIDRPGVSCFNLYRPSMIMPGLPAEAQRWVEHIHRVYPEEAAHIILWLAHRVQRPGEKINHALVLGGAQGIGKDTILEPVKQAVGPWNFAEVSPQNMLGQFNGYVKSVILRVSEARDLGDTDRFKFYDHMKTYTAAPPDVHRVNEKFRPEYAVFNVCGVIITTNHKTDGIYLSPDDRRHFVAWSPLSKEDFTDSYWSELYAWYEAGGMRHVAAFLGTLDISGFNPKAPPPKTAAFWSIVDVSRAPEDSELVEALERLGNPPATTLEMIASHSPDEEFRIWISDRKNARTVPHRLEECGYERVRNEDAKDGYWKLAHGRVSIYARKDLSVRERVAAARQLVEASRGWG